MALPNPTFFGIFGNQIFEKCVFGSKTEFGYISRNFGWFWPAECFHGRSLGELR